MAQLRLADRVAVVVGAGQTPGDTIGNGRATALLLAREGATVVAVDRDKGSAEETVAQIVAAGGRATAVRADATQAADCEGMAAAALDRHGRIDILVNNVGIGTGDDTATRLEEAAWDRIHEVNLKAMWLCCKHVLPHMRDRKAGAIVNISSVAAIASTGYLAYKTSKAAVNAMTQQLAIANARRGIRVNAVMPGLIDTPMAIEGIAAATGLAKDELRRRRDAMVPLGQKMGTAWDVAHAVLFLASDEARFVTGVALPVDGGTSAKIG